MSCQISETQPLFERGYDCYFCSLFYEKVLSDCGHFVSE